MHAHKHTHTHTHTHTRTHARTHAPTILDNTILKAACSLPSTICYKRVSFCYNNTAGTVFKQRLRAVLQGLDGDHREIFSNLARDDNRLHFVGWRHHSRVHSTRVSRRNLRVCREMFFSYVLLFAPTPKG